MIANVASFVFGVWTVQQLSYLPSLNWMAVALVYVLIVFCYVGHDLGLRKLIVFVNHTFFKIQRLNTPLQYVWHVALFAIAFFLIGVLWATGAAKWRMQDALPHHWQQKPILVEGVIASVPSISEKGERFRFVVEQILTKEAIVPKHLGLSFYYPRTDQYRSIDEESSDPESSQPNQQFHAGERWQLTVKLKRPHGTINPHGFDFEAWALSENIRATGSIVAKAGYQKIDDLVFKPNYVIEYVREIIKTDIAKVLVGQPYVGVIQALVMGDDSAIDVSIWQVLLRTGVTHLMSISGLHITMLSGLAFAVMYAIWRRLPKCTLWLPARKAATVAGVLMGLSYALIAGFSVPTQRTFYMLMVVALALWYGKQFRMDQILTVALFVVLLIDPWSVNSAGFWLSFGAVALIGFSLNGRVGELHWLRGALKTQWAVTIGMLPILLVLFNQVSIISPLANAIAIPVVSFIVTPTALLSSFLSIDWLLVLSHQCLSWLMDVLNWLAALPIATWHQHQPKTWTFLPAIIGALILLLPKGLPLKWLGVFGFFPMMLIAPSRPAIGEMKVTVLDVGQGLSVHVQTAHHDLIYDAGATFNQQSDAGSRIVVPYLYGEGVKQLDGFIVSHDDNDHSGGVASILSMLPVKWLLSSYSVETNAQNIKKIECYAGQHWQWDKVQFQVLYPTIMHYQLTLSDNNKSCVVKVSSRFGSFLLTGDIEKFAEYYLLDHASQLLKSDVMIVPHHGSKTSSTVGFLDAVSPQLSIAGTGYLNRFGHPNSVVLDRYEQINSEFLQSDKDGAVVLTFNQNDHQINFQRWRAIAKRYWFDDVNSNY
jgi:competence protein ComEC